MQWDPGAYESFRAERERPFLDLLGALPSRPYRRIIDAGCGTGRTTRLLAERWPEATVVGVDASPAMLAEACGPVAFLQADIATWRPAERADLVVANAVLHWIPGPRAMVAHLASWLARDGVLAIQVPANHDAPSHRIVREVAAQGSWAEPLRDVAWGDHVLPLQQYRDALETLGLEVRAWDTTYEHRLAGRDAVARWLRGTTLRPVFERLDEPMATRFYVELEARLRSAYPEHDGVVRFPFTRRFVVAGP